MNDLTPQEFADKEYSKGYKAGIQDAICELLALVSDDNMDDVFQAVKEETERRLQVRRNREYKARWG
jgi:hypothetical protein